MRDNEIVLGDQVFSSKKALGVWIKNLLKNSKAPIRLRDINFHIIYDLISYHPKAAEKIGCGIEGIWIQQNPSLHSGNRFIIERTDGSLCDFSYKYCLGKNLPSHGLRVREAMRNEVRPYIMVYRDKYFAKYQDENGYCACQVSGNKITPSQADVDHIFPNTFESIVQNFLCFQGISVQDIALARNENSPASKFIDETLRKHWIRFHNKKCDVRIVDKKIHLEI